MAIEISRKSWVVGLKSPLGEKIGLHTLGAADVEGLKGLIVQHRSRTERALSRAVEVGADLLRGRLRGVLAGTLAEESPDSRDRWCSIPRACW